MEASRLAKKRDQLHVEIRETRSKARNLRDKRDEINFRVQQLKSILVLNREDFNKRIEEIKSLNTQIKASRNAKSYRGYHLLIEERDKIEWKIQTESLPLEEEKKLVRRVMLLETQLSIYKKKREVKKRIAKMKTELHSLKTEDLNHRSTIQKLAEQSQKFHKKMVTQIEKANNLQIGANNLHNEYVELRNNERVHQKELKELLKLRKALSLKIHEKEEKHRTKLRKELEKKASDKLKQGKKLTFEEFRILAEQKKFS